ncbi:serine/threonine-protein kinase ULK2 [Marchantia polymorpha subsp. ruderalis]|uniref:Protein kinase domain-containing protein n=2 Tax=Marchantia polymorpha TaxID=3197 RepID=A0AAF6AXJ8_MARPO|nr:hypothetical protein MARPO_0022s0025 [Marchantia polymorpha]BBN04482.1 hypothetical protein Mp_3g05030 [Marchantia polymorpha subsp. ruderalis]|eukprot:PTQ43918.1 hypothetical protein MARPO_0022s0025 [Marchantia polymorpha]
MAHRAGHHGHHEHQHPERIVGKYIVTQQIGSGSFAVVWKARSMETGEEVAIKEIATDKLNPKLQESLLSEIDILKCTHHPNIIRLLDMVITPGKISLVLEYCTGGDLNAYIQRHGRVSEAVARHFMRQLGAGLQVLRASNLIHRDLKPQNLLLSTDDQNAVLKIADFGFARSLQPQGMAETICGSPLYMAPEILQRQKYNAKADLWSVGAILYQLVTGRPPFHGNSHVQLLLNIVRTNEVKFPEGIVSELHVDCIDMIRKLLKRNPVERLSFEEFFNHNFMQAPRPKVAERSPVQQVVKNLGESSDTSQEDCFPFSLDDEHQGPVEVHSASYSKPPLFSASPSNSLLHTQAGTTGKFSVGTAPAAVRGFGSRNRGVGSGFGFEEKAKPNIGLGTSPNGLGTSPTSRLQRSQSNKMPGFAMPEDRQREPYNNSATFGSSKGGAMMDSMEFIEREYVLVGNLIPSVESFNLEGSVVVKGVGSPQKNTVSSAPLSVTASPGPQSSVNYAWAHGSLGHETFQGPPEETEGPSPDPQKRLASLKRSARLITELATDKREAGQILESFAVQLVCLAIWKESLHVCIRWAAQAEEGNQTYADHGNIYTDGAYEPGQEKAAATACSSMEREFSAAVDRAEELALHVRVLDGCTEMQDAMELIYQAALAVGRAGAVEELMGNVSNAAVAYSKAAALFHFILVEAPHLPLNPPLVLNANDRYRLRRYADSVIIRQNHCSMHISP